MQLGTRWNVGATPPERLPDAMVAAIAEVEAELVAEGVDATTWRWTLTWLEGRPIAQLDDGTTLELDPLGSGIVRTSDD